jgi:hypothetical protein
VLTTSDSVHPALYIESKLRASHAVRGLHDEVKREAAREHKTPLLALFDKGRPGCLFAIHSDDLPRVLLEYAIALSDDDFEQFSAEVREARAGKEA